MEAMNAMPEENFHDVTLKHSSRVLPLATVNAESPEAVIPEDITFFHFQRIIHTMDKAEDLQPGSEYELAHVPRALFTEQRMRKTNRSDFQCFQ